jgi:cytochrome c biogenesis protein CcdA
MMMMMMMIYLYVNYITAAYNLYVNYIIIITIIIIIILGMLVVKRSSLIRDALKLQASISETICELDELNELIGMLCV